MIWLRYLPVDPWMRDPLSVLATLTLVVCFLIWFARALRTLLAEWRMTIEPVCCVAKRSLCKSVKRLRRHNVFGLDRRSGPADQRRSEGPFNGKNRRTALRRAADRRRQGASPCRSPALR
jgi:hypothetical protein